MEGVTTVSELINETTGEIAIIQDNTPGLGAELANLNSGKSLIYSSVTATDFDSRVAVLEALGGSAPLDNNIGKEILLKDVIIQPTIMPNAVGVLNEVPRITLIAADGSSFHVMSDVVYKDLKNIFGVLGSPSTWPAPVPVIASKESAKVGKFITLRVVRKTPAK